jgi:succinate dehydrogenase / fumarate reductase cytochrome b subunit
VSILHRASGMLMFFLLPFVVWLFDVSLTSEISYGRFTAVFAAGAGFVPGWFFKLVALALIWAYLHHFIAGVRHLWMDATHSVSKEFGRQSAVVTIGASLLLTLCSAPSCSSSDSSSPMATTYGSKRIVVGRTTACATGSRSASPPP